MQAPIGSATTTTKFEACFPPLRPASGAGRHLKTRTPTSYETLFYARTPGEFNGNQLYGPIPKTQNFKLILPDSPTNNFQSSTITSHLHDPYGGACQPPHPLCAFPRKHNTLTRYPLHTRAKQIGSSHHCLEGGSGVGHNTPSPSAAVRRRRQWSIKTGSHLGSTARSPGFTDPHPSFAGLRNESSPRAWGIL